jgi:protein-S-isoprenylcysteine O-methyltransferase Ste14
LIRLLFVLIGIVGLVVGIRRATSGTQSPLRSGNYKGAGAALASGLLIALGGFVLTVLGLSWSLWATLVGALVGGLAAAAGGRALFRDIRRQVSGG